MGGLSQETDAIDYYHGLLPREDLPYLLREQGDFLVRSSEVEHENLNHQQGRVLILSVCTNKGKTRDTRKVKHVVLARGSDGRYRLGEKQAYDSVHEMLTDYVHKRESVVANANVLILAPVRRQRWELKHDEVELTKKLGEGAFGEVHKGRLKLRSGQKVDVAVKLAKASAMTKEKIKEMMKEARIMRAFDHPNIVKLYGVVVEREPLLIVMEFINGGALDSYLIQNRNKISAIEKLENLMLGAALGLEYLHEKGIIHRDVAARNCLYADGRTLKISDFGLSREGKQYVLSRICKLPTKWLAPETINHLVYSPASDIWSYGILVYEVYAMDEPYPGMNHGEVRERVLSGYRMPFPEGTPISVAKMVTEHCWATKPEARWSASQIVRRINGLVNGSLVIKPPKVSRKDSASSKRHRRSDDADTDGGSKRPQRKRNTPVRHKG